MEEKLMDGSDHHDGAKPEGQSEDDPWEAAASASSSAPAPSGVPEFGGNQWQFYCRPVYDCIEFLLLLEFIKQCVVDKGNGKTIAKDVSGRAGMESLGIQIHLSYIAVGFCWKPVVWKQCDRMNNSCFWSMNVPLSFNQSQ